MLKKEKISNKQVILIAVLCIILGISLLGHDYFLAKKDKVYVKTNKNSVIILSGELGAGKTKFTEGFLSYFGLENEISSPTFTIVNEYKNDKVNIFHFDVYRLEDIEEFYAIGGEEYFTKGICIIEWGELIKDALPEHYTTITICKDNQNTEKRILKIEEK